MKISVITPIYNMADNLRACIESIIKQSYKDFELVLVDDGSKDDSYEICLSYANRYSNIMAVHQENQGSGPARNTGIAHATGDYYLFIDSDDILHEDALNILADRVKEEESDLIVFGYRLISPSGQIREKLYKERFVSGTEVRNDYTPFFGNTFTWGIQGAPWNKLFKAEVVKKNHVEYPALRRHQDEVFISRFVACAESIRFITDCLYSHFSNDVKLLWRKYPKDYLDIVKRLYAYRKEVIVPWNENNETLRSLIYSEFINDIFRACFRLFDSENKQSYIERKRWYKDKLSGIKIESHNYPRQYLGNKKILQNKIFVFSLRNHFYWMLDLLVKMRLHYFINK